jgi:hypothetical protein
MEVESLYKTFLDTIPFIVAALGAIIAARQLLFIKKVDKVGTKQFMIFSIKNSLMD